MTTCSSKILKRIGITPSSNWAFLIWKDAFNEIKRHLLLGRKATTNLDKVLKGRYITLLTKVRIVKAMVFPVVMYGCESWTIKKAEHQRIGVFELCCWRRLLRVPWARRSNQSILKEINLEYSPQLAIVKQMTGRNRAAQLAIVKQMSRH